MQEMDFIGCATVLSRQGRACDGQSGGGVMPAAGRDALVSNRNPAVSSEVVAAHRLRAGDALADLRHWQPQPRTVTV